MSRLTAHDFDPVSGKGLSSLDRLERRASVCASASKADGRIWHKQNDNPSLAS